MTTKVGHFRRNGFMDAATSSAETNIFFRIPWRVAALGSLQYSYCNRIHYRAQPYLVSTKKENLQAVVFKVSYFQTQRGGTSKTVKTSPHDSFVGFGGGVPPPLK